MIARHIINRRSPPHHRFEMFDNLIALIRPMPTLVTFPSVDEVTDQVNLIGSVRSQKIEALPGLRMLAAEMHIADQQGSDRGRLGLNFHASVLGQKPVFSDEPVFSDRLPIGLERKPPVRLPRCPQRASRPF